MEEDRRQEAAVGSLGQERPDRAPGEGAPDHGERAEWGRISAEPHEPQIPDPLRDADHERADHAAQAEHRRGEREPAPADLGQDDAGDQDEQLGRQRRRRAEDPVVRPLVPAQDRDRLGAQRDRGRQEQRDRVVRRGEAPPEDAAKEPGHAEASVLPPDEPGAERRGRDRDQHQQDGSGAAREQTDQRAEGADGHRGRQERPKGFTGDERPRSVVCGAAHRRRSATSTW